MKKDKIFLYTILLFCIVLLFSFLIPNFTRAIQHNAKIAQAQTSAALDTPLSTEEEKAKEIASRSKYDAREDGIVPPIRNQGSWNLCWAFSAIGASEINILKHGYTTKDNINLSAINLAYNTANRQDDPLHNTYEDVFDGTTVNSAGYAENTPEVLSQWRGLTTEDRYLGYDKNEYILKECQNNVAESTDIAGIKKAIATYGAVTFSYKAPTNTSYAYYYNTTKKIDHQSVIIGWDDSISKTKFSPQPAHDGAWIVRNSWGANAHTNGYFYFSYDSLFHSISTFDYVKSTEYNNNYFYDGTVDAGQSFANNQAYAKMANVFEVKKSTSTTEELIKAVNIAFDEKDVTAEIEIYTELTSLHAIPDSGKLLATKQIHFPHAGYYTIDLDTPVSLDDTQFYSVVVKLSNPTKNVRFISERSLQSTYDFCYYYDIATNSWKNSKDVQLNKIARIKAYTINRPRTSSLANNLLYATVEREQPYSMPYTEQLQYPTFKVTFNNKLLTQNTDYSITYSNNRVVGIASAEIQGIGNYTGSKLMTWNIFKPETPPNLPGTQDPSGSSKRVLHVASSVSVYSQIPLPAGWSWVFPDYSVQIGENKNNYVKYYDEQNYVRAMFDTIVIKDASTTVTDIASAQINILNGPFCYTGSAIQPQISVVLNGVTLVANTDYIVHYSNNIDAGTAQLTIQGIGQYTGNCSHAFTINKAERPYSNPPTTLTIYANTDLATIDFGSDWQLKDSSITINVGETKDIEVVHKYAHNYKTGTTAIVRITRLQETIPPITNPDPPKPVEPVYPVDPPQPTPTPKPTPSPSDSQTTTNKSKIIFLLSLGGGILILTGATIFTVFFIKRKKR